MSRIDREKMGSTFMIAGVVSSLELICGALGNVGGGAHDNKVLKVF